MSRYSCTQWGIYPWHHLTSELGWLPVVQVALDCYTVVCRSVCRSTLRRDSWCMEWNTPVPGCNVARRIEWYIYTFKSWWRHQMEPFSALLALCAGNSPVTGEFTKASDAELWCHRAHYNVTVMLQPLSAWQLWIRLSRFFYGVFFQQWFMGSEPIAPSRELYHAGLQAVGKILFKKPSSQSFLTQWHSMSVIKSHTLITPLFVQPLHQG